jgi:hypothetical protein
MPEVNCYTCDAVILTYESGKPVPSYVVVAPGAVVPGGNHVVHTCPEQPVYVLQARPTAVLDWSDEVEVAAVAAALPEWESADSDQIVCMSWYDPGYRFDAAPSAPLTVQVRRNGVELGSAVKGVDFDEVSLTASAAAALADQIGADRWPRLLVDLESEVADEEAEAAEAETARRLFAEAVAVYAQAADEARAEADHAIEHADADPDDEHLQQVAKYANDTAVMLAEQAAAMATV